MSNYKNILEIKLKGDPDLLTRFADLLKSIADFLNFGLEWRQPIEMPDGSTICYLTLIRKEKPNHGD